MTFSRTMGPTMPSSPTLGNLPSLRGPLMDGILMVGAGSVLEIFFDSANDSSPSSGARDKARSLLRFHCASICAHFSSVSWWTLDVVL